MNSFFPNNGHPIFDTVDAIGDFSKVVFSHFLLSLIEGAVIATGYLQNVSEISSDLTKKNASLNLFRILREV